MTSLFITKLALAAVIFIVALLPGLIPIMINKQGAQGRWLSYGESFSGGIFLSAGLLHLLPEGIEKIALAYPDSDYPLAFLICVITILLLRVFEKLLADYFDQCASQQFWCAYILVILLSVHSVIEGAALGVSATLVDASIIGFAILAHKGAEAFALTSHLNKHQLTKQHMMNVLIIFSLMTPIGIAGGSYFLQLLSAQFGTVAEGIFNTIAAGTFIYIATQYHFHFASEPKQKDTLVHFICFSAGTGMLSMLMVWM